MLADQLPPACLDVTIALRFMVEKEKDKEGKEIAGGTSCVTFHQVSVPTMFVCLAASITEQQQNDCLELTCNMLA